MFFVLVASGKGGTGKTLFTLSLAKELSRRGVKVGILDGDIDDSNTLQMLGIKNGEVGLTEDKRFVPIRFDGIELFAMPGVSGNKPVSMDGSEYSEIVHDVVEQTAWSSDYCVVDCPAGCLVKDAHVFANPGGAVPICEIKEGSEVYSFEGGLVKDKILDSRGKGHWKWRFDGRLVRKKVAKVIPQGVRPVFAVRTWTREIEATDNHPFLVARKDKDGYSLRWVPLSQIGEGDFILVLKKLPDEGRPKELPQITLKRESGYAHYPSHTTDDLMRILGYFLGDGYLHSIGGLRKRVEFCEPKGTRIRQKYENLVRKVFGVNIWGDKRGFNFSSRRICELIGGLDLDHKALDKFVSNWVFGLPKSQRVAFIEGYCDADGHRRKNRELGRSHDEGNMEFESPNKKLIEGIRNLCISVGMRVSNVGQRRREQHFTHRVWKKEIEMFWFRVISPLNKRRTIRNYLGSGIFRFGGPKSPGIHHPLLGFDRVIKKEYIGPKETYDLEIESGDNFVSNGILVHNSADPLRTMVLGFSDRLLGAVVVMQPAHAESARRTIEFFQIEGIPVLGLVENMSGFRCEHDKDYPIFGKSMLEEVAKEYGVEPLGRIPLSMEINEAVERGQPFLSGESAKPIERAADVVLAAKPIEPGLFERLKQRAKGFARGTVMDLMAGLVGIINTEIPVSEYMSKYAFPGGKTMELDVCDRSMRKVNAQMFFRIEGGVLKVVKSPKRVDTEIRIWDSAFVWSVLGWRPVGGSKVPFDFMNAWLLGEVKYFGVAGDTQRAVSFLNQVWKDLSQRVRSNKRLMGMLERLA